MRTRLLAHLVSLIALLISGCGQITTVQIPRNEFVLSVDHDGNPTYLRTQETRAIIDLYAGRGAKFPPDKKPRIVLKPTPGKEQKVIGSIAGFFPNEVLMSRPSGGYFAFFNQVPVTRYFKVLGRSDCDDAVWKIMKSVDLVRRFNQSFLGSGPRGASQTWNCLTAVEYRWKKDDYQYKESDGVIFRPESVVVLDKLNEPYLGIGNLQRLKMDGWAIKFVDPTPEDFNEFLSSKDNEIWTPLQEKQWQTLLYWIESNADVSYASRLVDLLPTKRLHPWREIDHRILHTIAKVSPDSLSEQHLIRMLSFGVDTEIYKQSGSMVMPISHKSIQNSAAIMANVLACKNNISTISVEQLKYIAKNALFFNYRDAAIYALTFLGDATIIAEIKKSRDYRVSADARWFTNPLIEHPFHCPYGAL